MGRSLAIAMVGTRGVPPRHGGFETAVEEIGARLVSAGHRVDVFGRERSAGSHKGMRVFHVPALPVRVAETPSRALMAALRMRRTNQYDALFLFNVANAPLLRMFKARRVFLNVDGVESQRSKWPAVGRSYLAYCEKFVARASSRGACRVISDSEAIAEYYRRNHQLETEVIPYGAPLLCRDDLGSEMLPDGIASGAYHLLVARVEPENQVLEALNAHRASRTSWPLVFVGKPDPRTKYGRQVMDAVDGCENMYSLGAVYDQDILNALYVHAGTYVHGHSVGGTNPSLLRAHGAGALVLAFDCPFNREVSRDHAHYWQDARTLTALLEAASLNSLDADTAQAGRDDVVRRYDWDKVALAYLSLAV